MNSSDRYPEGSARKEPIRRPRKACTTCRALKTRCLPDGDNQDPKSRCSRCARLNLECCYDRGRRGRRKSQENYEHYRTSPPSTGPSSSSQLPHRLSIDGNVTHDANMGWKPPVSQQYQHNGYRPREDVIMQPAGTDTARASWTSTEQPRTDYPPYSGLGITTNTFTAEPHTGSIGSLETNVSPRMPNPNGFTPHMDQEGFRTSFVEYMEPPIGGIPGHEMPSPPVAGGSRWENQNYNAFPSPLDLGYISESEAQHLFRQFMSRVATSSCLFDVHYHTFERVRKSGVLFSAILYAASRFFRPDLEEPIHSLTEHLISRSMMQGQYNLQLVQAICVVVYWKHPRDKTFYQKLGVASRLICELRYAWPADLSRQPPVASEDEERRRVDIERTVHNVNGLDLAYSFLLQLPPYHRPWMPEAMHVLEWAESHRHLNIAADFFKAFIATFWEFYGTFGGHPRMDVEEIATKMPADMYQAAERRVNAEIQRWSTTLASVLEGQYAPLSKLIMKTTLLKVRVVGFLRHIPSINASVIFTLIDDISEVVKRIAEAGELIFLSDIMVATVSSAGAHLYALRARLSVQEKRRATIYCRKMAEVLAPTLTTGGETTLRYVERFYRNLSRAFEDMSNGTTGDDPQVMNALHILQLYKGPATGTNMLAPTAPPQSATIPVAPLPAEQQQPQQGYGTWLWPDMSNTSWMEQSQGPQV